MYWLNFSVMRKFPETCPLPDKYRPGASCKLDPEECEDVLAWLISQRVIAMPAPRVIPAAMPVVLAQSRVPQVHVDEPEEVSIRKVTTARASRVAREKRLPDAMERERMAAGGAAAVRPPPVTAMAGRHVKQACPNPECNKLCAISKSRYL